MNEEIKEDNNCIVKAFENNPISILTEEFNNKKIYLFKVSDIGKALKLTNIRVSIQNYDESDEVVVRKAYDTIKRNQDTLYLTSQGVYRLLYNSKKEIAKKFRKWAGNILDDIIFNESAELKRQLQEKETQLEESSKLLFQTQKQLEQKTKLKVKKWYDSDPGDIIYAYKSQENNSLITIGKTKNVKDRESKYMTHNQNGEMFYIKKCYNCDLSEKVLHHILDKYRVENNREWFEISEELSIYIIDTICQFLDNFVNCSDKLPEFKIKEYIENLDIKKIQTDVIIKEPTITIPIVTYNKNIKDYTKFISEMCEISNECDYKTLPSNLIACYRFWCKGDMTADVKKSFNEYMKNNYKIKTIFLEDQTSRTTVYTNIKPKELIFKPDNENYLSKYDEFIIDKCHCKYTFRIGFNVFVDEYKKWLDNKFPNNTFTKNDEIDLKAYINKKFFITLIPGTIIGMWGIQMKSDNNHYNNIKNPYNKKVYKINIDTNEILEIYDSLSQAADKLNKNIKELSDYIKINKTFEIKTSGNILRILLKYDDVESSINYIRKTTAKKVYKINNETNDILQTYDSLILASKKFNIGKTTIRKYIINKKILDDSGIKYFLRY
jgi:prophage antirepressor-like protein